MELNEQTLITILRFSLLAIFWYAMSIWISKLDTPKINHHTTDVKLWDEETKSQSTSEQGDKLLTNSR